MLTLSKKLKHQPSDPAVLDAIATARTALEKSPEQGLGEIYAGPHHASTTLVEPRAFDTRLSD